MTITTLECVLLYSVVFLFYIQYARAVAPGVFRGFQTPTIFQTFKKIYYKCIPMCNCVCFELSFKAAESLKLLPLPLRGISFIQNLLHIDQKPIREFIPFSGKYNATTLYIKNVASF